MPTQIQFRRGTTAQHASFTGAVGEVTVDTDKEVVVVHDGSTAGGFEMARSDVTNVSNPQFSGTSSLLLPVGTTAQRPASPSNGQMRYNSSTGRMEAYQNGSWSNLGGILSVTAAFDNSYSSYAVAYNNYPQIPGMSVTVTPKSADSRFWIMVEIGGEQNHTFGIRLKRNGTYITTYENLNNLSTNGNSYQRGFTGFDYDPDRNSTLEHHAANVWDYPNTTSQVTYTLHAGTGFSSGSGTYYHNRTTGSYTDAVSKMTCFEYLGDDPA